MPVKDTIITQVIFASVLLSLAGLALINRNNNWLYFFLAGEYVVLFCQILTKPDSIMRTWRSK